MTGPFLQFQQSNFLTAIEIAGSFGFVDAQEPDAAES